MYQRKTQDVWVLQGNYGDGWEDLTAAQTHKEIQDEKRLYEANEAPYVRVSYRIRKLRVKKDVPLKERQAAELGKILETAEDLESIKEAEIQAVVTAMVQLREAVANAKHIWTTLPPLNLTDLEDSIWLWRFNRDYERMGEMK